MINQLRYSGDAICTGKVSFPTSQEDRQSYANAVSQALRSLNDSTLSWMENFEAAIDQQVGSYNLQQSEAVKRHFSVRFYLWTREHPKWALVLKIMTLGAMILLERAGRKKYETHAPLIQLAEEVRYLNEKVNARQNEVYRLEQAASTAISRKTPPEKWLSVLQEISWNRNGFNQKFFNSVRTQIISNSANDLSDPESYQSETRYNALTSIYELMVCPDQLAEITEGKLIYTEAKEWDRLDHKAQMALLNRMTNDPRRFAPLLNENIEQAKQELSWDKFKKLKADRRQNLIERVAFLQEELPRSRSLENAFSGLCEDIQQKGFKECSWSPEETRNLEEICEQFGLADEFSLAQYTHQVEANWDQLGAEERLENTRVLILNASYYAKELGRRSDEIFRSAESSEELPFEQWKYLVEMLETLRPFSPKKTDQTLKCVKEQLLSTMSDDKARQDKSKREEFIQKANLLGLDPDIINDLGNNGILSSFWKFVKTGKTQEKRLEKNVNKTLVKQRIELRKDGVPTKISRVASQKDLYKLTLNAEHMKVTLPSIIPFEGEADIKDLLKHLRQADALGLIQATLKEVSDDNRTILHTKQTIFAAVEKLLNNLPDDSAPRPRGLDPLSDRQKRVREILKHYTFQLQDRLKKCKNQEETREIYEEIVEYIAKGMGFAYFHCEDRKFNAAMVIYNEKIAQLGTDEGSTEKKVQVWAAKKRDELVTQMLQEMIVESILSNGKDQDVASAVGRWRYALKDDLGLGDVPEPQYDFLHGGLTEDKILRRFYETYTPEWLLQQAMAEYRDKKGAKVMHSTAITEFLESRLKNFEELAENEDFCDDFQMLLEGGMAIFLQETGIFNPIV